MEALQGWEVAGCLKMRSCSLNSLKGVVIIGDCVGDYYYYRVMIIKLHCNAKFIFSATFKNAALCSLGTYCRLTCKSTCNMHSLDMSFCIREFRVTQSETFFSSPASLFRNLCVMSIA